MPKVSVLLPVYNGAEYLQLAIESILNQTFKDFELLIVNDGSTDSSEYIIQSYKDARIRYVKQANIGLTLTLNRLIQLAQGTLLARMDQDDWSHPERIEKQVAFLKLHPNVRMCGSWIHAIDTHGKFSYAHQYPVTNHAIKEELLFTNPFAHGSVVFRKAKDIIYRTEYNNAEDIDNWARQCMQHFVANLPEYLYHWRINPTGISHSRVEHQKASAMNVITYYRDWYLANANTDLAPREERIVERHVTGLPSIIRRKRSMMRLFRTKKRYDLVRREWRYLGSLLTTY